MPGLAEPRDDDAALGFADNVDGLGEGDPERALKCCRKRADAAEARIERAQCRLDSSIRTCPG
jgi:hypothetical protein